MLIILMLSSAARPLRRGRGGLHPGTGGLSPGTGRALSPRSWARASAALALGILGCVGPSTEDPFPEPRPLGKEIPASRAPAAAPGDDRAYRDDRTAPSLPSLPTEPEGAIGAREALAAALIGSPALAAFSWDVRAAEARELQAGVFPNPELSVDLENVSGDLEGFRDSETTVSVAQSFLLGGKRSRAVRFASLEREVAGWEYEAKRLDLYSEVVQAFVSVLGAQEDLKIAEEMRVVAERVLQAAAKRVEAGAAPSVERTRAEVALSRTRTEVIAARQALRAARIRLALTWGSADPRFSRVEGSLETEVALPAFGVLRDRLTQNPDLIAAAARLRLREAALDLERSNRIPDVTVAAGYRRLEADDANTLVFGVSMPIPLWNLNRGAIQEAAAGVERAGWENRAMRAAAEAALADAYSDLAAALEEEREYAETILPGSEEAFRKTQEGYERGGFDYIELLTAQETLARTRRENVEVLVRLNLATARLERLLGAPIPRPEEPSRDREVQR